jgi:hypothetical protein
MRSDFLLLLSAVLLSATAFHGQTALAVQGKTGLRLVVAEEDNDPALHVILPGNPDSDRTIYVLFPEHVTVRKSGEKDGKHLYMFRPGAAGTRPAWRKSGSSLEYEKDLEGNLHLLARATVDEDGVLFQYQFTNPSTAAYEMIYAPTDPRLTGIFHDVRLQRTYVHHANGFDLLASETPNRLTMPLDQWLPARYLASFTWPVPPKLIERRDDDITYYNKSRPVDEPLIATISKDDKWIVASFTRTTGNVWSNPELTCQHVDPEAALGPRSTAKLEIKLLVFPGSLQDALKKALAQRLTLQ